MKKIISLTENNWIAYDGIFKKDFVVYDEKRLAHVFTSAEELERGSQYCKKHGLKVLDVKESNPYGALECPYCQHPLTRTSITVQFYQVGTYDYTWTVDADGNPIGGSDFGEADAEGEGDDYFIVYCKACETQLSDGSYPTGFDSCDHKKAVEFAVRDVKSTHKHNATKQLCTPKPKPEEVGKIVPQFACGCGGTDFTVPADTCMDIIMTDCGWQAQGSAAGAYCDADWEGGVRCDDCGVRYDPIKSQEAHEALCKGNTEQYEKLREEARQD